MKLLVFVLNDSDLLSPLLKEFNRIGVNGCTILDSNGMGRELVKKQDDFGINFGSLRALLKPNLKNTKTLLLVLKDDRIPEVVESIEKIVGSLEQPGSGILFTLPLDYIKGLKI